MQSSKEAVAVSNIFCIGKNYAAHISELGNKQSDQPLVFLKPTSALNSETNIINLPTFSNEIDYEAELVLLVGKHGKYIKPEDAFDYIKGYAIGLDLTARDLQTMAKEKGLPWLIAKGFDNAATVSNFLLPAELGNPKNCYFSMKQNGILRQKGDTKLMLFDIPFIICYLSNIFTLYPGDLIFTGTPEGVGKLNRNDMIELNLADKIITVFSIN